VISRTLTGALAALLLFLGTPAQVFAGKIQDYVDVPVPTLASGERMALTQVQESIFKACYARKWVPRLVEPGKLSVSILVRGVHYAEVSIPFSPSSYSILYVTSRELDANEKKRKIHDSYNKWVGSLNAEIARQLALAMSAT
jgi:hypothetical protein